MMLRPGRGSGSKSLPKNGLSNGVLGVWVRFYRSVGERAGSMSFRVERDTVISASPARMGWPAGA